MNWLFVVKLKRLFTIFVDITALLEDSFTNSEFCEFSFYSGNATAVQLNCPHEVGMSASIDPKKHRLSRESNPGSPVWKPSVIPTQARRLLPSTTIIGVNNRSRTYPHF